MSTFLVLTVIADDKPGIVEKLANTISNAGGNWLESRMAQMAGKFAGILKVAVETENQPTLMQALTALQGSGINVFAEETATTADDQTSASVNIVVNVVANDRPGIVSEVSATLAKNHVNVLELTSYCESAEMSAVPTFRAQAIVELPATVEQDSLIDSLEALSDDLMVEISSTTEPVSI